MLGRCFVEGNHANPNIITNGWSVGIYSTITEGHFAIYHLYPQLIAPTSCPLASLTCRAPYFHYNIHEDGDPPHCEVKLGPWVS